MIDFNNAKDNLLKALRNFNNETWNDFLNNPMILWAPPLNSSHLKNCHLIESREKMLEYLPHGGVVCEVGTQYGKFAEKILSITSPQKFHIIDLSLSWFKQELKNNPDKQLLSEKIADNTVKLHEGDSSTILAGFPDNYFDWIYIDGDHS